jgi:ribonuclease P protein component
MLPKKSRIPRKLFSELLINSKYVNSPDFSLRYSILPNIKDTKIGVSVSKKVSKSAVNRNTIRRRAYSALAPNIKNIKEGLYLFVAKSGALKLKEEKLQEELENLLDQAGRLF